MWRMVMVEDDESDNDAEDVADDSDIASLDLHAIRLPWVIVRSDYETCRQWI